MSELPDGQAKGAIPEDMTTRVDSGEIRGRDQVPAATLTFPKDVRIEREWDWNSNLVDRRLEQTTGRLEDMMQKLTRAMEVTGPSMSKAEIPSPEVRVTDTMTNISHVLVPERKSSVDSDTGRRGTSSNHNSWAGSASSMESGSGTSHPVAASERVPALDGRPRSSSAPTRVTDSLLQGSETRMDPLKRMKYVNIARDSMPKYCGRSHEDFDMFSKALYSKLIFFRVEETDLIHVLEGCFPCDAPAGIWFQKWKYSRALANNENPFVLRDFLSRLEKKFAGSGIDQEKEAKEMKQGIHEKALDYTERKRLALMKVGITDKKAVITYLVNGVHDSFITHMLSTQPFIMGSSSVDDACDLFSEALAQHMAVKRNTRDQKNVYVTPKEAAPSQPVYTEEQALEFLAAYRRREAEERRRRRHEREATRDMGQRGCFRCGQLGHYIRDCPQNTDCRNQQIYQGNESSGLGHAMDLSIQVRGHLLHFSEYLTPHHPGFPLTLIQMWLRVVRTKRNSFVSLLEFRGMLFGRDSGYRSGSQCRDPGTRRASESRN